MYLEFILCSVLFLFQHLVCNISGGVITFLFNLNDNMIQSNWKLWTLGDEVDGHCNVHEIHSGKAKIINIRGG